MEDSMIVELYFSRNEEAVRLSREKYGKYCYSVAYSILSSHEDSEECEIDTFLRAWNSIPPQKPRLLSAFLAKITRNLALNRLRARNTQKRGGEFAVVFDEVENFCTGAKEPQMDIEEQELASSISAFLRKQPKRSRLIFVGRYWNLLSISELSHRFGMSESAVKTSLSRTRSALSQQLKKEGYII